MFSRMTPAVVLALVFSVSCAPARPPMDHFRGTILRAPAKRRKFKGWQRELRRRK